MDGSPAHNSLPTYAVGCLGAISSPHRDALQHRGLQPANVRRLLCDVVLTTILLHKRHAVPVLPLAGNYSPQKGGPLDKILIIDPPLEWYHVSNWSPTPGAAKWPAWDVILSLWLSGGLLLAPDVGSAMATRRRRLCDLLAAPIRPSRRADPNQPKRHWIAHRRTQGNTQYRFGSAAVQQNIREL